MPNGTTTAVRLKAVLPCRCDYLKAILRRIIVIPESYIAVTPL